MRASWVSAGPETPALQQLKEAGSQVSRGPTSPGPSKDLESRPRSETPQGQILEEPTLPLSPGVKISLCFLLAPFGPLSSGWELTSLLHLWGNFSSQTEDQGL